LTVFLCTTATRFRCTPGRFADREKVPPYAGQVLYDSEKVPLYAGQVLPTAKRFRCTPAKVCTTAKRLRPTSPGVAQRVHEGEALSPTS
jgi:hypothetical protein